MGFLDRVAKAIIPKAGERPGGELGGVPARAVVVEKRGHGTPDRGTSTRYVHVDLVLRVVGEEQTTQLRAYVAHRAAVIATAGLEVPVRVDESTGALLGLDGDAWEAEAQVLDAEYEAGTRKRGDQRTSADVLAIDDADAALAPIAGVDMETWLAVEVGLVADGVHNPADHDAYAAARGVPAGEWAAVSKEWNARARKDFRLATRLGAAHQAAADARG